MGLPPATTIDLEHLDSPLSSVVGGRVAPAGAAGENGGVSAPRRRARRARSGSTPGAVGEAATVPQQPDAAPDLAPAADRGPARGLDVGDPMAGSPKVAINMRATKALWDALGAVLRLCEDEGLPTSRTELTEALWASVIFGRSWWVPGEALDGPRAIALVRSYRAWRLGPVSDAHAQA